MFETIFRWLFPQRVHFSCQNIWPLKYRGNNDRMRSSEMLGHSKRITRFPLGHSPCSFVNCPSFRRTVHLCICAQCAFERIWAHCAFIHLCALLFSIICVHFPFFASNFLCTLCIQPLLHTMHLHWYSSVYYPMHLSVNTLFATLIVNTYVFLWTLL